MPEVTPPVADPVTPPVVTPPVVTPPVVTPPVVTPPVVTKADAWRDTITDAELKKAVDRFDSPQSLAKSYVEIQKWQGGAIKIPAKDAKPEEVAAYREKLGVPTDHKGYEIARPAHIEEAAFNAEPMKAALGKFAESAHTLNLSKDQFKGVMDTYWKMETAAREQVTAADKANADATEAALRKRWPGEEYDANKRAANKAAAHFFGEGFEDARKLETKSGRFLLDHPAIVEAFAKIGREMGEDRLGPTLSDSDLQNNNQKIRDLGTQMHEAHLKGDRYTAARLDKERLALIQKTRGNGVLVGAQGRTV